MAGGQFKLSATKVAKLAKPGRYGDGHGLWLQVSKWGTRSWLLRYWRDGKERQFGLGPLHTVSLSQARERARTARFQLLDGGDPIEAKREQRVQRRLEAARGVTFKECGEKYIAAHESSWKNAKHREQWQSTLATYAYPAFDDLPVAKIDTPLVLKAIEPIWQTKPETLAVCAGGLSVCWIGPRCAAIARAKTPPGGKGT